MKKIAMDQAEAQALIRKIYRGVLKREADPSGENYYMEVLQRDGYLAIKNVIDAFVSSAEFEGLIAKNFGENEIYFLEPPTEQVISLGVDCLSAWKIKQIGRRNASFPFDWCFSAPEMLNHILEDDFNIFLDEKYYQSNANLDRDDIHINQCDHNFYYDNFGISYVFNHKDPTKPYDYNYYERAVDRFRKQISSDSQKLFILVSWRSEYQLSSFMKLMDILRERSHCHSLFAINVRQIYDEKSGVKVRYKSGNDCLVDFYSNSTSSNGLNFDDHNDDQAFENLLISRLQGKIVNSALL